MSRPVRPSDPLVPFTVRKVHYKNGGDSEEANTGLYLLLDVEHEDNYSRRWNFLVLCPDSEDERELCGEIRSLSGQWLLDYTKAYP